MQEFQEHIQVAQLTSERMGAKIDILAQRCVEVLKSGGKILICGNGGSAADAQHFSAELTGRYKVERMGLPAIALSTDTSALSAIGNDYGFEHIFSRQVQALAKSDDMIFAISTSGNSANVINALREGRKRGCYCVGLSGKDGGEMNEWCEPNIVIPSSNTPRIQEMHILIIHYLCQKIDEAFNGR